MRNKPANSLLIVILLISILTSLSLGLAKLMATDTASLASYIHQSKANYLAEGLIEMGMYQVKQNPQGRFNTIVKTPTEEDPGNPSESYTISNRSHIFPYPEEPPLTGSDRFYPLTHNQSITLKLDSEDSFLVEYFLASENSIHQNFDILLWKLFGTNNSTENPQLESLSEFFPAAQHSNDGEYQPTNIRLDHRTPAKFGSMPGDKGFNCGTFFAAEQDTEIKHCGQLISEFLSNHTHNYLVLSNAVNAGFLGLTAQQATIYLRVCQTPRINISLNSCDDIRTNGKTIIPQDAKITAEAKFGDYRTKLETYLNPKSLLPVFDYALYQTNWSTDPESF